MSVHPATPLPPPAALSAADGRRRVVIERVSPTVDDGRFPAKRVLGDLVEVAADIFGDGHDAVAAVLRARALADPDAPDGVGQWRETPMRHVDNDRWSGGFTADAIGRWEFTITAWIDPFASWAGALRRRLDAHQVTPGDLLEGAALIRAAASRARASVHPIDRRAGSSDPAGLPRSEDRGPLNVIGPLGHWVIGSPDIDADTASLESAAAALSAEGDLEAMAAQALDPSLASLVARYPDRTHATTLDPPRPLRVDRERACAGAWYEMFPRSEGASPGVSGTFADAAKRLPEIAAMGFDVLYLPPIHPIGETGRKGPGNTPAAGSLDPGSPWAIGGAAGGHMAVDPGLGTLDDFDWFVRQARDHGLEIALDIAFQCSPDHPYVREHPEWFRHRPDGSIKYAENPPKKYQDIYPFDFETEAWPSLWEELLNVVRFWALRGVRIFRVDNPHTKPFPFWEWLIARVQHEFPDTIFLSEAFTRPKVMLYLAKLGFTQSYTYFTWRNTKDEIASYFTELARPDRADVLRPNLFANTPDILHAYLQTGGRTAFEIRLVLAATLGASYGIYSGFEICENEAVPGTEEYLHSEKYQFKPRDWQQPSNIRQLIRTVNRIRRAEPALVAHANIRFHDTDNPEIVAYTREHPAGTLFVVVSLDPHRMQHGLVRTPLAELGVDPAGFELHDLLDDGRYTWRSEWGYVRFDPGGRVAHIFKTGPDGPAGVRNV